MKYITVKLTEDQTNATIFALKISRAFAVYGDGRAEHQAFMQRIIAKVTQAVKKKPVAR